jgi:hypothetical protein
VKVVDNQELSFTITVMLILVITAEAISKVIKVDQVFNTGSVMLSSITVVSKRKARMKMKSLSLTIKITIVHKCSKLMIPIALVTNMINSLNL